MSEPVAPSSSRNRAPDDGDRDLAADARAAMLANGFIVDVSADAADQALRLAAPVAPPDGVRDLRDEPWSSIDNVDTLDLDQLEVATANADGSTRVLIAVADVDALVAAGSPIDRDAAANTTSVYTGIVTFNMLPDRLSTDITSLRDGADRLAVIVEYTVTADGDVTSPSLYRAMVRNHAQLAYETVGGWLDGTGPAPATVASNAVIAAQLALQHAAAQRLRARRDERGALQLATIEARPVMRDGRVVDLEVVTKNVARELIEDFMIAANVSVARWLESAGRSAIRRVVREPDRWARIVALAEAAGDALPDSPSAPALSKFLERRRAADPDGYPELSLSVVKLLGAGQYAVERAGETGEGHFGLATDDYAHSTAPNRRYADLVTQRVVKAAIAGAPAPYSDAELETIAARCTAMENAAHKVERLMRKKVAAVLLGDRIGAEFDAVVTGARPHATYVRLLDPPVEGRVVQGEAGLDVGDHVRVRLLETDIRDGFIDFAAVDAV